MGKNDHITRVRLVRFGARCLTYPGRGGRHWSLVSAVNRQLNEEADKRFPRDPEKGGGKALKDDEGKLAERLASSEDTL